jgi:hypothetical protein
VAQRTALDNLLLTEERRLMLTNVQVAYAATPLDGPNAVRASSAWKIGIGLAAGLSLGCIVALALAFLTGTAIILPVKKSRTLWRQPRPQDLAGDA